MVAQRPRPTVVHPPRRMRLPGPRPTTVHRPGHLRTKAPRPTVVHRQLPSDACPNHVLRRESTGPPRDSTTTTHDRASPRPLIRALNLGLFLAFQGPFYTLTAQSHDRARRCCHRPYSPSLQLRMVRIGLGQCSLLGIIVYFGGLGILSAKARDHALGPLTHDRLT